MYMITIHIIGLPNAELYLSNKTINVRSKQFFKFSQSLICRMKLINF